LRGSKTERLRPPKTKGKGWKGKILTTKLSTRRGMSQSTEGMWKKMEEGKREERKE